jgi:hypothetical protein
MSLTQACLNHYYGGQSLLRLSDSCHEGFVACRKRPFRIECYSTGHISGDGGHQPFGPSDQFYSPPLEDWQVKPKHDRAHNTSHSTRGECSCCAEALAQDTCQQRSKRRKSC